MKTLTFIIVLFLLFILCAPVYAEEKILYSLNTSDDVLIRVDGVWVHDTGHLITNGIGEEGIAIAFSNQTNNYEDFYGSGNDSYLDLGVAHNISRIIFYCGDGVACYYSRYLMFYGSDNPNTNFTYIARIAVYSASPFYDTPPPDSNNPFGRYRYLRWRWSVDGASVPDTYFNPLFDELEVYYSIFNLSGYVTDNIGDNVTDATITLNNSGGSTTSNDIGYYEISGLESGTYTITATSPTHNDYSDTVSITTDTEKNITMNFTPTLSNVRIISTTTSEITIGWDLDAITDNVKVYRDTNTNQIGQSTNTLYTDTGLAPSTRYNYWLEPWDGAIVGAKYAISGSTGSAGGGVLTPTPTITPLPTVPLDDYPDEYYGWGNFSITVPDFWKSPLWLILLFMLVTLMIVGYATEERK